MGLSDREYYRDDQPGGFSLGGERSMSTNLVIANVAIYAVCAFMPGLTERLSLHADVFGSPRGLLQAWQFLTYGFVHAPLNQPGGIFHILMNMYILWMFGRIVETRYGRAEFLRVYLAAIVFAGVAWALRQLITGGASQSGDLVPRVLGASGGVTAVVILFCLNWPKQTIYLFGLLAMPAYVLGLVVVGLDMLRALDKDSNVAWDCHLAGALFALAYVKLNLNLGRFQPNGIDTKKWFKSKPKLRVHDPDAGYEDLDDEADRVLDKLHREGESSLNARERKVLEAYSRRMRQKHR